MGSLRFIALILLLYASVMEAADDAQFALVRRGQGGRRSGSRLHWVCIKCNWTVADKALHVCPNPAAAHYDLGLDGVLEGALTAWHTVAGILLTAILCTFRHPACRASTPFWTDRHACGYTHRTWCVLQTQRQLLPWGLSHVGTRLCVCVWGGGGALGQHGTRAG